MPAVTGQLTLADTASGSAPDSVTCPCVSETRPATPGASWAAAAVEKASANARASKRVRTGAVITVLLGDSNRLHRVPARPTTAITKGCRLRQTDTSGGVGAAALDEEE